MKRSKFIKALVVAPVFGVSVFTAIGVPSAPDSGEVEDPNRIVVFTAVKWKRFHSEMVLQAAVAEWKAKGIVCPVKDYNKLKKMVDSNVTLTDLKADVNGITAVCSDAALAAKVKAGTAEITLAVTTTITGDVDGDGNHVVKDITVHYGVHHNDAAAGLPEWGVLAK